MTAKTVAHTATPWEPAGVARVAIVGPGADGDVVAICEGETLAVAQANAAFIVQACNAHEQLVEALKEILGLQGGKVGEIAARVLMKIGAV